MRTSITIRNRLLALALSAPLSLAALASEPAPPFSAKTIDNQPITLAHYQGNTPVLLKFWATWCSYCVEEMPSLQATARHYGDRLAVVTVNVGINDSISNVQQLFERNGFDLPVIFDHTGELTSRYNVIGTPTQVLIDRDGNVRMRSHLTTDRLEAAIAELAGEQEGES